MSDQGSKPDFIVDPWGNARDVRNENSLPPASTSAASRTTSSIPQPAQPRAAGTTTPGGGMVFIPIGLIITLLVLLMNRCSGGTSSVRVAESGFSYGSPSLGDIDLSRGEYDKAIVEYTADIFSHPDWGEAYNNRGLAYFERGEYDKALADFNKAIDLTPDSAIPYSNSGAVYHAQGALDEALASLNKALELNPKLGKAFYNRGLTYFSLKDYDKAIADFGSAIEVSSDHYSASAPMRQFELTLEARPHPTSQFSLMEGFKTELEYRQSYADLPSCYTMRAAAYMAKEDYAYAHADLDKALELQPDLALAYYKRALAHYELGDQEAAHSDLQKVIELNSEPELTQHANLVLLSLSSGGNWLGLQESQSGTPAASSNWLGPTENPTETPPPNGLGDKTIYALAVPPDAPATVYAGAEDGVYKSTDGGANWKPANDGLRGSTVTALVLDPRDSRTIYASTDFEMSGGPGIFKSVDGGMTWNPASNEPDLTDVRALVIDPKSPDTLYASICYVGIFKTTDGGVTWSELSTDMSTKCAVALAIDPWAPTTLYAATASDGAFKSTDGGQSWNPSGPAGQFIISIAVDPSQLGVVYAGALERLYRSPDGGEHWQVAQNNMGDMLICSLVVDPTSPDTLYVSGGSLFRVTDSARDWHVLSPTPPVSCARNLALGPDRTLYMGTEYNGVQIFADTGGN